MVETRDLILYVDDEEQALKYFRMVFTQEYEVLTATSVDEALPLVEEHGQRLALVVTDQRMPGRSGVELLTIVKDQQPQVMRLLTTAYSDLTSAIDAVNKGEIYAYITKPWKLEEFKVVIKQALQLYHLRRERDALVAEKLGVFQQLLLVDYSRLVGMAVAGLTGRVARPLAAAAAWLGDRQHFVASAAAPAADPYDLWPAVVEQSKHGAHLAAGLGAWLGSFQVTSDAFDPAGLLAEVAQESGARVLSGPQASSQQGDQRFLRAGVQALLQLMQRVLHASGRTGELQLRDAQGTGLLTLELDGSAVQPMSLQEIELTGLSAYIAVYHHHGAIDCSQWSALGGVISLQLGGHDDDGEEAYLACLADLES